MDTDIEIWDEHACTYCPAILIRDEERRMPKHWREGIDGKQPCEGSGKLALSDDEHAEERGRSWIARQTAEAANVGDPMTREEAIHLAMRRAEQETTTLREAAIFCRAARAHLKHCDLKIVA